VVSCFGSSAALVIGCLQEDFLFDLVNGIPLHPLVVHAVVVLLPLAIV
jgi:hypothetical protein